MIVHQEMRCATQKLEKLQESHVFGIECVKQSLGEMVDLHLKVQHNEGLDQGGNKCADCIVILSNPCI